MKKGITPVISTIILLLITIALAGTAWTYLQGFLTTQIAKSFNVPTGGAFCTNGVVSVTVVNTGTTTLSAADFTVAQIDNIDVTANLRAGAFPISVGKAANILSVNLTLAGITPVSGSHTVSLVTAATATHPVVVCP